MIIIVAGTTSSDTPPFLVLLTRCDDQRAGTCFDLVKSPMVAGRLEWVDIVVKHGTTARNHARFELREGAWWVQDLGAANGVFVNDEHVGFCGARELHERDSVRLGGVEMRFSFDRATLPELWTIDEATGLHTDGYLYDALGWMLSCGVPVALAVAEIDEQSIGRYWEMTDTMKAARMQKVNKLAELARDACGPTGITSRWWHRFSMLMPRIGIEEAVRRCESLRAAAKAAARAAGWEPPPTFSIGVAHVLELRRRDEERVYDLIRTARDRSEQAGKSGGNLVVA